MHFVIAGIANIVGTMALALGYDYLPSALVSGVKINLLEVFGKLGGLGVNLSLLIGTLCLVLIYRYFFFKRGA